MYKQLKVKDDAVDDMIAQLLTMLHDESLALMDLLQIPTTHQVKCFLNKSFTSASEARKCIQKIEASQLA